MNLVLRALFPLIGVALSLSAAPVLDLNPSSQVAGLPGQTVGWGFTLTNNTDYLVVESFAFETAPASLGTFTDFSQYNFIDVGPAPDESPSVTQLFSLANQTGVGSFQFSAAAQPGTTTGAMMMTYQLYDADPINGGNPIGGAQTLAVPASIVVNAAPAPEPGTLKFLLFAASIVYAVLLTRTMRRIVR